MITINKLKARQRGINVTKMKHNIMRVLQDQKKQISRTVLQTTGFFTNLFHRKKPTSLPMSEEESLQYSSKKQKPYIQVKEGKEGKHSAQSAFELKLIEGKEQASEGGEEEAFFEQAETELEEPSIKENKGHYKQHPKKKEYIQLGVPGFDTLLQKGIPKASSILVCGGAGTGKTIFGLQAVYAAAKRGEKAMYMSFEESEDRLREHMHDFGWDCETYEKKGLLIIKRYKPFDITKTIEALLMKAKGELIIDLKPVIFPQGFQPDILVIDSLSAISAAFVGREETYRVYIEQLFLLLEKTGTTSLLITETEQIPSTFLTKTGIEEFLADGVILLYYVRLDHRREHSCEILKMRGSKHVQEIVPVQITDKGIRVCTNKKVQWQKRKSIYADKLPVYHS